MLPLISRGDALGLSGRKDAERALDKIRQCLLNDEVDEGDGGGFEAPSNLTCPLPSANTFGT